MDWNHVRELNAARKRKHGPRPDPDSLRQKLFVARELSRKAKEERDASTAGCTWETSTRGGLRDNEGPVCCANWRCSTQYSSLVVGRLRKHYAELTQEGRRAFLAQRSPVGGIIDRSRPIQGQKVYKACLESPLVLGEKLARMSVDGGRSVTFGPLMRSPCAGPGSRSPRGAAMTPRTSNAVARRSDPT